MIINDKGGKVLVIAGSDGWLVDCNVKDDSQTVTVNDNHSNESDGNDIPNAVMS